MTVALTTAMGSMTTAIAASPSAAPTARVTTIEKRVTVARKKAPSKFGVVRKATTVAVGDTVRTDVSGFAEMQFGDGSLARIDRSTSLQVTRLVAPSKTRTRLAKGQVWSSVAKSTGSVTRYSVETPGATATARGTQFAVTYDGSATTVAVVEGTVSVTVGDQSIDVPAGYQVGVDGGGTISPVVVLQSTPFISQNVQLDAERKSATSTATTTTTTAPAAAPTAATTTATVPPADVVPVPDTTATTLPTTTTLPAPPPPPSVVAPGAPVGVSATAGSQQATVTWGTPASDGGSPITQYRVRYAADGGTTWSAANPTGSTATATTITGLTDGTAYQFQVSAVNAIGAGAWSSASSPVTPVTPMTLVVDTTLGEEGFFANYIGLPLRGAVNATIDWGGTGSGCGTQIVVDANRTSDVTCMYDTGGIHTIRIGGTFAQYGVGILGSDPPGAAKITAVSTFGSGTGTTSYSGAFLGAANLVSVPASLPPTVTDLSAMFVRATLFDSPNIASWDVTNVTNLYGMFVEAYAFDQNIGGWNTANVTNMQGVFYLAASFDQNIGGWDTSSVTNMSFLFGYASSFNQDISGWDTASVTDMTAMFEYATSFNRDLSGWCVPLIPSLPTSFALGATSWTGGGATQPQWGTCPGAVTIAGTNGDLPPPLAPLDVPSAPTDPTAPAGAWEAAAATGVGERGRQCLFHSVPIG